MLSQVTLRTVWRRYGDTTRDSMRILKDPSARGNKVMTEQSMDLQGDINLIISVPTMLLSLLSTALLMVAGLISGWKLKSLQPIDYLSLELASVALPQFFNHSQLSLPKIGVPNPAPGICCACLA